MGDAAEELYITSSLKQKWDEQRITCDHKEFIDERERKRR